MTSDGLFCPLPSFDSERIELAHGAGGPRSRRLVEELFLRAFDDPELARLADGARLSPPTGDLAFTTDGYVVSPLFFPGGDIGRLAVCGTVNDLAMCGARPLAIAVGFVLEEGLALTDLARVAGSMAAAAREAAVRIVTGDTKVVERGRGDGIYLSTTGIGEVVAPPRLDGTSARPGDLVLVSGDVGRHGAAVLAAREGFAFADALASDVAPVAAPVLALLKGGLPLHALRDPTRGGVAGALIELARAAGLAVQLEEEAVPVGADVRGACEILGLDPLHLACEGRFVAILPETAADAALAILRGHPVTAGATIVGRMVQGPPGMLVARTPIGGERVVDSAGGEQLPRIC